MEQQSSSSPANTLFRFFCASSLILFTVLLVRMAEDKVVLTVRLLKSLEYATVRNLVLTDIPLDMTVQELMDLVLESMRASIGL